MGRNRLNLFIESFRDYLLSEYYLECIVLKKGYRLNLNHFPHELTISFLNSLLNIIKNYHYQNNNILDVLTVERIFDSIDFSNKTLKIGKEIIISNAKEIFEKGTFSILKKEIDIKDNIWHTIEYYPEHLSSYSYLILSSFIYYKLSNEQNRGKNTLKGLKHFLEFIKQSSIPKGLLSFTNVSIVGADFAGSNFVDADFSGSTFSTEGHPTNKFLNSQNLSRDSLDNTAELNIPFLLGSDFSGSNLARANFSNTNLSTVSLTDAFLGGINLREADLRVASLQGQTLFVPIL